MKKIIALTLALILALPLAAGGEPKTRQEAEAAPKNFSISLVFDAEGQKPYHFYQASCEEGMVFEMKGERGSLYFVDFVANKMYDLDPETKTGESEILDPNDPDDMYRFFDGNILSHTFTFSSYKDNMTKTGNEKIIGRDTTVYTVKFDAANAELKIWVDDEYGFSLKYVQTGGNKMSMEVTEFKDGGVTVKDMKNKIKFDEYKID